MPTTEMRCHWCQIHFYDGSVSSDPILSLLPPLPSHPPVPPPRPSRLPPHTHTHRPRLTSPSPSPSPHPFTTAVWCGGVSCGAKMVKICLSTNRFGGVFFDHPPPRDLVAEIAPSPSRGRKITKKYPVCEIHEKMMVCGVAWCGGGGGYLHAPCIFLLKPQPQV